MDRIVQFFIKLPMNSVGALANQVLSVWAIAYFSLKAGHLLDSVSTVVGVAQSQHSYGFQIFVGIMSYLGYKVTVNAASNHGIRTTSREALAGKASIAEATERGKAVGAAEALVVKTEAAARLTGAFPMPPTGEYAAQVVPTNQINVGVPVPPLVADPPPEPDAPDDHEWKEGDPRAGVL